MSSVAHSSHAFRALFDEHAAFVWRVLKRHGVADREIEDASQEVFMIVHRRLSEFEGRSSMRTWLYGIAARVALGARRKAHAVRERLTDDLPERASEAPQLQQAVQRQRFAMIDAALATLSDEKREVFALYELEGMTMAEVASSLGVPENTALYRLYGAREEIQSFIKRRTLERASSAPQTVRGIKS